jgi:hypothetical protein
VELGTLDASTPRRQRKIGRWILLALVLAGAAYGARRWWRQRPSAVAVQHTATPAIRVVPAGTRIRVEVLNATDTRGLARRAMQAMRDAGFDVVYFGNTKERADSSVVLDRSGHPDWAELAAKALRGARVESKPDTSRYLDLTILVGSRWLPPADLFNP